MEMVRVEGNRNLSSPHTARRINYLPVHQSPPYSSKKRSPEDDRHLGVVIHIHDNEIVRDDELAHLNCNILHNTQRSPEGAIY